MVPYKPVEAYVWDQALAILRDPASFYDADLIVTLQERDTNSAGELSKVRSQLTEISTRRDTVSKLVGKGCVGLEEAESIHSEIEKDEAPLTAELARLEDGRSLTKAYMTRVQNAIAMIKGLQGQTDIEDHSDQQRIVKALLTRVDVVTERDGLKKRPQLTFHWLMNDNYTLLGAHPLPYPISPSFIKYSKEIAKASRTGIDFAVLETERLSRSRVIGADSYPDHSRQWQCLL